MASQAKLSRIALNKILVATDFAPESEYALQCAIGLARRNQSTLTLTHVLPNETITAVGDTWPIVNDIVRENAQKSMATLEEFEEIKTLPHEAVIASGDTGDTIVRTLVDKHADLVVMGTHGRGGVSKLILGSAAEKVIRHAPCPVLTVGPHVRFVSPDRFNHIFYATDFSSGSAGAFTYALSLAEEDQADLTLLHVIESKPASETEMMEWKQGDRERLSRMIPADNDLAYKPEIEVEIGIPEVEIVRLADARSADLIVMGSHGGGAVSTHLPWTTLHHVLQHAHCPVLTVRGQ